MRRNFWMILLVTFPIFVLAAGIVGWRFYQELENEVVARFSGHQWEVPSKLYAEATLLYPGLNIEEIGLLDRLTHLDYRPISGSPQARGEYQYNPKKGEMNLFLHDWPYANSERRVQKVGLSLQGGRIERLTDLDEGADLSSVELEPEVITGLYDQVLEERRVVKLYDVPSFLIKALLAAEDQRFFEHEGIDVWRIVGAAWANLMAGRAAQGGSTLTQQLVKNFFLSQERTMRRKLVEVSIAIIVENHYSKLEILENYLNEIYLGQRGAKSIFGMWEAARFYFGKELRDLTLGEMAVLAGMVKAPNLYSPIRHPEQARQARNVVLQRMLEHGDIAEEEYQQALQEPIGQRTLPVDVNSAPYFADLIKKELEENYSSEMLTTGGLHVSTTLDMRFQRIAQEVVRSGLEELEAKYPRLRRAKPEERLQACLIAIQPQTGAIRAMVGGRDYQISQFNRVTQAHRQPGSVFKPVVYLTALMQEREHREGRFLPTSVFEDEPFTWFYENKEWSPGNYKNEYLGTVTLRRALEMSLNAATARIAEQVGIEPIRETAHLLGFVSPLPPYPSLVLGSAEVTPLEVAVAFSTIANQGMRVTPLTIRRIMTQQGDLLERRPVQVEPAIAPEDAYLLTHLLEGVLDRGTGHGARQKGFERPAAGKTGTTNDYGDAWFVGFTPDLLTVVWVGFDIREPLGLSGGQAALPIWTAFMKRATLGHPAVGFTPPPGVILVPIDRRTGCRATAYTQGAIEEAFYSGEEPSDSCSHGVPEVVPVEVSPDSSPQHFPESPPSENGMSAPPVERPPMPASRPAEEKRPWWRIF